MLKLGGGDAATECATSSDIPSLCETCKVLTCKIDLLPAVDTLYTLNDSKTIT